MNEPLTGWAGVRAAWRRGSENDHIFVALMIGLTLLSPLLALWSLVYYARLWELMFPWLLQRLLLTGLVLMWVIMLGVLWTSMVRTVVHLWRTGMLDL